MKLKDGGVLKASSKRSKSMKAAFKTQGIILPVIEQHLLSYPDDVRSTKVLHPSEFTKHGWCPRSSNYQVLDYPRDKVEPDVSPWLRRIFGVGDDAHTKYQSWMWDVGNLLGNFFCVRCELTWWARSPRQCPSCAAPRFALRYNEVPVVSERYLIGGHADGIYVHDPGDTYEEVLVEIKSVGEGTVRVLAPELYDHVTAGEWKLADLWNEIRQPFSAHLRQSVVYALVLGIKKIAIIYECKWNQAWREFDVVAEPWMVHSILTNCEKIAKAVETGDVIDRPTWAEPEHATCKGCPYRTTCWSTP